MRNLKKLFAVVMTVAMLVSVMVPALAADGFKYEADAQKLYDLGLFKGNSETSFVPDLGATLNRQAGLALAIRLMGKDAEVAAMSSEEVATQLAKIVDADEITDWAKPYAAYAVKNGLTNGIDASILPNVKFGSQLDLTGKEFINFVLKAMGYQAAWDDVLAKAADVGMLTASQAVTFGTTPVMTRDAAVGVMASALTGTTSGGITLAQKLVDDGAVSGEAMATAGYFAPTVAPTEAPKELTATASGDNLLQINVVYSQEVDKDSAEKKDNYDIDDVTIDSAKLQDDGVTVVLTLAYANAQKQQAKLDLTISGVKDTVGTKIAETTLEDVELFDKDIPTAVDAAIVGKDTFKVTFSEPMKGTKDGDVYKLDKADFVVNGGKTYVKEVRLQNNYTEALVEMYSNFKEGEITLQVKSGSEDFAGFGVIGKTFTLDVIKDEEAPIVIGYKDAKPTEITLIWSEDIEFSKNFDFVNSADARANFYHTNAKNPVRAQKNKDDGTVENYAVKIDGNKMTLYFDKDTKLPAGTAYVYVAKEAAKDLWDNKNAQQMIKVDVELDETAPEVDGDVAVKDENKIEISFTEELDKDTAEKEANYTILNDKGEEVKNIIDKATYSSKKVTILFEKDLNGDYSIVIEGIKDAAGNEISEVTLPFNVGDKTAPDTSKFTATVYKAEKKDQMLKIDFKDTMATEGNYSVTDVSKYVIERGDKKYPLEDISGVKIVVVDDGKSVEIFVPSNLDVDKKDEKLGKDYIDLDPKSDKDDIAFDKVIIGRVADAANNKMVGLTTTVNLVGSTTIGVDKVEVTARDTVKATFKDELAEFDADDFILSKKGDSKAKADQYTITGVETEVVSGKTVAIFTVNEKLKFDLSEEVWLWVVPTVDTADEDKEPDVTESANRYGKTLTLGVTEGKDKIKPELYNNGKDTHFADPVKEASGVADADAGRYIKDYFRLGVSNAVYDADFAPVADNATLATKKTYYFKASLFFSEELTNANGSASLMGQDLNIKLGGTKLVNGKDYVVVLGEQNIQEDGVDQTANELVIFLKAKEYKESDVFAGYELKGDLEIDLADSPNYIVDAKNGNTLKDFDTIELDDVVFKAAK